MTSERREEEWERQSAAADDAADASGSESSEHTGEQSNASRGEEEGWPGGGSDSQPENGGERSEADELRDRYLRLAAEFDNYRKRTERERAEHSVRAQGKLVQNLLDAIDDLERVADYTPETTTVAALLEGVQMVERRLLRALEAAGLEVLDARGAPFDPTHHEALMTASTEAPEEDETVGEVFQKGYRFQGHLLRPARVQVRKHEG